MGDAEYYRKNRKKILARRRGQRAVYKQIIDEQLKMPPEQLLAIVGYYNEGD